MAERDATPDEAYEIGYTVGHTDGYREGAQEAHDPVLLQLLAAGVPWYLAIEAIATTRMEAGDGRG